jgi:hypothetical protein
MATPKPPALPPSFFDKGRAPSVNKKDAAVREEAEDPAALLSELQDELRPDLERLEQQEEAAVEEDVERLHEDLEQEQAALLSRCEELRQRAEATRKAAAQAALSKQPVAKERAADEERDSELSDDELLDWRSLKKQRRR